MFTAQTSWTNLHLWPFFFFFFLTSKIEVSYAAYPTVAAAHEAGYATMNYGLFFQNIIDFIIIAFCIFCVIRAIAKAKEAAEAKAKAEAEAKAAAEAAAKAAEPPAETVEDILKDIRAALKK